MLSFKMTNGWRKIIFLRNCTNGKKDLFANAAKAECALSFVVGDGDELEWRYGDYHILCRA